VSREEASAGDDETAGTSSGSTTGDDGQATTTVAGSSATTGAPDDVAASVEFADGEMAELRHGELNEIVGPTQENAEFVALVYQGVVPAGFDTVVLSQTVLAEVIDNELAKLDAETTDTDLDEAKEILFQQLEGLLTASTDPAADAERLYGEVPYLVFIAELQARQIALSARLAATADDSEGNPCVRHILVATEAEAGAILTELAADADFSALAAERSTDPGGSNGGDLGCAPAAQYVAEFAEAVDSAVPGEYVGPIQTQFGWHVLIVDRYEVDGDVLADEVIRVGLSSAKVEVDERLGAWDTDRLMIVPLGS
jgi:parvulin-like peptidyl-prolyl isomerase